MDFFLQFEYLSKDRVDRALPKLSQAELVTDIKNSMVKLREPANFEKFVTDDLKCKSDAPLQVQQYLLIKKQNHLNTRLLELLAQNKKHVEILQKNMEESKSCKKTNCQSIESFKYIIKCLQEKLVNLEEQIEILTAVESR